LAIIPEKRKAGSKLDKERKEKITKRYSPSQSAVGVYEKGMSTKVLL